MPRLKRILSGVLGGWGDIRSSIRPIGHGRYLPLTADFRSQSQGLVGTVAGGKPVSWAKEEAVREVTVYELAGEYRAMKGSEATPGPPRSRNFEHGDGPRGCGRRFFA